MLYKESSINTNKISWAEFHFNGQSFDASLKITNGQLETNGGFKAGTMTFRYSPRSGTYHNSRRGKVQIKTIALSGKKLSELS